MSENEVKQVVQLDAALTRAGLSAVVLKRFAYVLLSSEDSQTITLTNARALIKDGVVFYRDDADTTTAHDGTVTLVSQEGIRFKSSGIPRLYAVETITNTPAVSPTVGSAYLVGTAPSGVWVGNANKVAIWSRWGWRYAASLVGQLIFVKDAGAFYHFNNSGVWTQGTGALSVSASAVRPKSQLFPAGVSVTSVTNTPPGSPADGESYIVGTTPTGVFTGNAGALAIYRSGGATWDFSAPYTGMLVWDQGTGRLINYVGGVWGAAAVTSPIRAESGFQSNNAGFAIAAQAVTTFSTAMPTITAWTAEALSISFAASSATNRLRFKYRCIVVGGAAQFQAAVALRKNSETVAQDVFTFYPGANGTNYQAGCNADLFHTPGDTLLHTYTFRLYANVSCSAYQRRLYVQEISA